jgi:hypothetical protein
VAISPDEQPAQGVAARSGAVDRGPGSRHHAGPIGESNGCRVVVEVERPPGEGRGQAPMQGQLPVGVDQLLRRLP